MAQTIEALEQDVLAGLRELRSCTIDPATASLRVEEISGWSVVQHVEHLVLSNEAILQGIEDQNAHGEPPSKPKGLTWAGRIFFWTGYIPRGRARAMKRIRPQDVDREPLIDRLDALTAGTRDLAARSDILEASGIHLPHPYFGDLGPRRWLRFMAAHQRHHLKIIAEIRTASIS